MKAPITVRPDHRGRLTPQMVAEVLGRDQHQTHDALVNGGTRRIPYFVDGELRRWVDPDQARWALGLTRAQWQHALVDYEIARASR